MNIFALQFAVFAALAPLIFLGIKALNARLAKVDPPDPSSGVASPADPARRSRHPGPHFGAMAFFLAGALLFAFLDYNNFQLLVGCYERSRDGRDAVAIVVETASQRTQSARGRQRYSKSSKISYDGRTQWMSGAYAEGEQRPVVYSSQDPQKVLWGSTRSGILGLALENLGIFRCIAMLALSAAGGTCLLLAFSVLLPRPLR